MRNRYPGSALGRGEDKPHRPTSGAEYLSFPAADATFWVEADDGTRLPVYALAGPAAAPALLFGHANGFSAGSYAPWLRAMARHARVFAYDARGHGASHWPEGPLDRVFRVDRFATDLAVVAHAVMARCGGTPLAYIGHSLGAAAAIDLEILGRAPGWARLVLFEPPISPPRGSSELAVALRATRPLVEATARRRAGWPSPEALFERLKGSAGFARATDAMLMAHCRAILKPKPDGGFTLACPPAVEAAIYRAHRDARTWDHLGAVTAAIDLVGGDPGLSDPNWISLIIGELARRLPNASLTVLPGAGHLMFFEQPDQCLELVVTLLCAAG